MSSVIRFKFRNAKEGDSILFEGAALSVDHLKKAIIDKKKLASGCDLVVTDALSGEGE